MKLEGVILQEDNVTHRDVGLWSGPLLSGLQRLDIRQCATSSTTVLFQL